jgi:hypothetical protein
MVCENFTRFLRGTACINSAELYALVDSERKKVFELYRIIDNCW